MAKFIVTFGQRYRHEPHPVFTAAHPDSVLVVEAPDEVEARRLAIDKMGTAWSMLYTDAEFFAHGSAVWYTRGAFGILKADGTFSEDPNA